MNLRSAAVFGAAAALTGCAAAAPGLVMPVWSSSQRTDRFTDAPTCRVTLTTSMRVDSYRSFAVRYYPYVERRGSEVRVGLMSHPGLALPVGAVQLRIDDLPAWTIEPFETPVDSAVMNPNLLVGQLPAGASPAQTEAVRRSAEIMSTTMTQSMSPYTAATGAKALQIVAQMKAGDRVIFRTTGANAASSAGEAPLGAEFTHAADECGI